MCIGFSKITLHRIGEKKTQSPMDRYDGVTLKKKIRDSRTDESLWPHSITRLFLGLVVQWKRLSQSIHRHSVIRLNTRSTVHPLPKSYTDLVRTSPDWLNWLSIRTGRNSFSGKEKKQKHFIFLCKEILKSLQILLLYPISILSRKSNITGVYISTLN